MTTVVRHKAYKLRLDPTAEQAHVLSRYVGCARFVYNWGLAARKAAWENEGKTLNKFEQMKAFSALRNDSATAWMQQLNSHPVRYALVDLDLAYKAFFARKKRDPEDKSKLRFRKKGMDDTCTFPSGVKAVDGGLRFPRIPGIVRYRDERTVEGKIVEATIKRELGKWYAAVVCKEIVPDVEPPTITHVDQVLGIDVGLAKLITCSDGTTIENPRFLTKALAKLRRVQRQHSKKKKGGKNRRKAAIKVATVHRLVRNRRNDHLHKITSALVKNHDGFAVEDLNISGMVKNKSLSRAISDVGWGTFVQMLTYKAEWQGKRVVKVDRWLPSSQVCSACGERKVMPLRERTYVCESCGLVMDRDANASLNIRAAGHAVLSACGGSSGC